MTVRAIHTAALLSARTLLTVAIALATLWGTLALWFQLPPVAAIAAGAAWCVLGIAAAIVPWRGVPPPRDRSAHGRARVSVPGTLTRARPWLWAGIAWVVAALAMALWWQSIRPSHDRVWADDVARLLEADVDGDRVTLRNVRNFDWRTETDYTPRWETRRYDLAGLVSADLILSYWMGPHIAHTLVSFGFADGRKLVFSLEIRKEKHERFSALGGFFREFEEVLVAADERDIVRTRSNARGEQVYLYRLRATPAQLRAVFLGYLAQAAQLRHEPAFYNTLTSNCTTVVFDLARQIAPTLPLDYRLLASGHFAEYAYDQGALAPGFPYAELQRRGYINPRALRADAQGTDFSTAIRAGVPGIP